MLIFPVLTLTLAAQSARGSEEVLVEDVRRIADEEPFSVSELIVDERLPAQEDLGSLLNRAPGTQLRRFGGLGAYTTVGIRGSTTRQVQVFLDGVPLNADGSATVNLAEWPLHAFSSVQIYRGNLPIQFAAAPIGGAINLVSHAAPPSASFQGGVGQYDTLRFNAMSWNQAGDVVDGLLMLNGFSTEGRFSYFDDNGTPYNRLDDGIRQRENNVSRQLSGLGRWRLSLGRTEISLLDAPMTRNEGLPGHTNTPTSLAALHTARNLLVGRARHSGPILQSDTQAWHQLRHERYDDRAGELGAGSQWSSQRTQALGLLHNTSWMAHSRAQLQATLAARRDWYTAADLLTGESPASPHRHVMSISAAAAWWAVSERLYLYPALNLQLLEANLDQQTSGGSSLHPRLALAAYAAPWLIFKANAGHFFRPPDYFELFGDRGAIIGNAELRPESSWQSDLGARLSTAGPAIVQASFEGVAFLNRYQDQIVYVQNAQRTMVPVNFSRSLITGFESSLELALLERWDLQGSLTYIDARNQSPDEAVFGKSLPNIPRVDLSILTSVYWYEWARLGASWTYVDRTYSDATNWYPSAQRNFVGLFARAGLPAQGLSLELDWMNLNNNFVQVSERNPLDAGDPSQILTGVTDFVGYPLPGRTWYLELAWRPAHAE
jgi:iron complex outermembrane receptor protein